MSTPASADRPQAQQRSFLGFRLGERHYALPVEHIAQIIEMVSITPITQLDACLEGVINVRGEVAPVLQLSCRLGQPKIRLQLHTPIILLHAGPYQVGWIVDEALSVFQLMRNQIRHSSDAALRYAQEANLIVSEIAHAERMWLLLDVQHLLTEVVPLVARAVSMAQQGMQARRVKDANGAGA